jgi:hypothetical protein
VEALVVVETLLLVLLVVLVAGLLRSHAEILRRLGPPQETLRAGDDRLPSPPATSSPVESPAPGIVGNTPFGDAAAVGLGSGSEPTLLAFLTSGCDTCLGFWQGLAGPQAAGLPGGLVPVIVTKDASHESPARLRELAPLGVTVVMSSRAWDAYAVPGSPYFVYVGGDDGRVLGEGVATGWPQLLSLLRDAIEDVGWSPGEGTSAGERRARRVDAALEEAGIEPGHPSLYPTAEPRA